MMRRDTELRGGVGLIMFVWEDMKADRTTIQIQGNFQEFLMVAQRQDQKRC